MENMIYRLEEPKKIVPIKTTIPDDTDNVVIRPTHMSICHADQRYYQGTRDPEVLKKKLPMALIHEGIGEVVKDEKGEFGIGTMVAMVPNTPFEYDEVIAENYLRSSKFRASGFDGFMQDYVEIRRDRVVPLPVNVDKEVAAFAEICSVCSHTIDRFEQTAHVRRNVIGIWGEGNIGFITALLLKTRLPDSKVLVFGVDETKLKEFTFVDGIYNVNEIPKDVRVDHAFECVGSKNSGIAVNQIIDHVINPEGTIALMGVAEYPVPINTRMVLEKGLRLFGSSRCGRLDFIKTLDLISSNVDVNDALKKLVGNVVEVYSLDDMHKAFAKDLENVGRKTVMHWKLK